MVARPYWINTKLAIVPRPRGGDWLDDEMFAFSKAGIDVLVSMIEDAEATELGLEREKASAAEAGMSFLHFPVADRGTPPDLQKFDRFLTDIEEHLANGKRIGIHCRGCIGRASVVSASLLIRSGVPAEKAWSQIEAVRGAPVPDTLEQLEWVARHIRPVS